MDAVLRTAAIYFSLMIIFRIAGKRSIAELTTFDFVLLLIIGEATQQALLGDDFSITNALLVIGTLIGLEIAIALIKRYSKQFGKVVDSVPVIIVQDGKPLKERMQRARVDEADVLSSARKLQGIERMEQIKYAVLETNGGITVIPKQ